MNVADTEAYAYTVTITGGVDDRPLIACTYDSMSMPIPWGVRTLVGSVLFELPANFTIHVKRQP